MLQHCEVVDLISNSEESALEEERRRSHTEEELLGVQSSPQIVWERNKTRSKFEMCAFDVARSIKSRWCSAVSAASPQSTAAWFGFEAVSSQRLFGSKLLHTLKYCKPVNMHLSNIYCIARHTVHWYSESTCKQTDATSLTDAQMFKSLVCFLPLLHFFVWFPLHKNDLSSLEIEADYSQIGPDASLARKIWATVCTTSVFPFAIGISKSATLRRNIMFRRRADQ